MGASEDKKIRLVAAIKETGEQFVDQALIDFYQDYFHHPMYKDPHWKVFKAMGGGKISTSSILKRASSVFKRIRSKGIESNIKGDGDFWTKGGVLIFNRKGELKYAQYERFGKELDMVAIKDAIHSIRAERI